MAAQAVAVETGQIELYQEAPAARSARPDAAPKTRNVRSAANSPADAPTKLCAGCRAKEARYGFESNGAPELGAGWESRPTTLCFECFRMEIDRRQRVAAQLARGWNAEQVRLPLADTLKELNIRRRRAQIAARHALGA